MIIHSLNLNEGGGIIPQADVSMPENDASVIIGIGGTGVDTIKTLKKKIYSQLSPSNPGAPVPKYDMISLLAMDADDTSIGAAYSPSDIDVSSEFINLKTPQLAALLAPHSPAGRPALKENPAYNQWMSIDSITPLLAVSGAGGIRQVGRFMLMQHIQDVYNKIHSAIIRSMTGKQIDGQVNIHIIAGISGGTGSGCFLDTCYLVRKILEENGIGGKIFGYFYLPDVVISKQEIKGDPSKEHLNERNGYAAFRELDYLMNLEGSNDWFDQTYDAAISKTHTQKPPVDLCHIISAKDTKGNIPEESYRYSINVVSDYIMAYLSKVELNGAVSGSDGGLTMQGHLTNVVAGVSQIPRKDGANLNYTILGASNAEIPYTQIATYLASNYFEKAISTATRNVSAIDVDDFAKKNYLIYDRLYKKISGSTDSGPLVDQLDEINMKDCLSSMLSIQSGHPKEITRLTDKWVEENKKRIIQNYDILSRKLNGYSRPETSSKNSLIEIIHSSLLDICMDSENGFGAEYAASLLNNKERNLIYVVDELINENTKRRNIVLSHTEVESDLLNARDDFKSSKMFAGGKWKEYKAALVRAQEHEIRKFTFEKLDKLLYTLREQLQILYSDFYLKLAKYYSNLGETFNQDKEFLANPIAIHKVNAYTWRLIELDEIKSDLDHEIENISPTVAAKELMRHIIASENQDEWRTDSDFRMGRLINDFMVSKFHEQLDRNIEDFIRRKHLGETDSEITKEIEENILLKADEKSAPMFWKEPAYLLDGANSFTSSTMTVPLSSTLVTSAAKNFVEHNKNNYAVREADINNRIFALRFNSGIPLWAYQGVENMKKAYLSDLNGGLSGLHLYEHNTAVEKKDEKSKEDIRAMEKAAWGTYLPFPKPFSVEHRESGSPISEQEAEDVNNFNRAKLLGIISQNNSSQWCIYNDENREVVSDKSDDIFSNNGEFDFETANNCLSDLIERREKWASPEKCKEYKILESCPVFEGFFDKVLLDTFMRCPQYKIMLSDNLAAYDSLCSTISNIEGLIKNAKKKELLRQQYVDALCTGFLTKGIGKITYQTTDFGIESDVIISDEKQELSPAFLIYKGFCGFQKIPEEKLESIIEKASEKMNNLNAGDDICARDILDHVEKNLQEIARQVANKPTEEKAEILNFYNKVKSILNSFIAQF